jgi:hypothetical protein
MPVLVFQMFYGKQGLGFGNVRNILYSGGIGRKGRGKGQNPF